MKKKIEMAKKSPKEQPQSILPAERTGFEPASQFCRLHAFQVSGTCVQISALTA